MEFPTPAAPHSGTAVARARAAVSAAFFLLGAGIGIWAVHIPVIAERLALDASTLGLALLGLAAASIVAVPAMGVALARLGSRATLSLGAVLFAVALPLPILAPSIPLFFVASALLGLTISGIDVPVNAHATEVEAARGRPTMSSFHGFYSLGGLAGSGVGALFVATGFGDGRGGLIATVLLLAIGLALRLGLLPTDPSARGGPAFVRPTRAVLGLGLLCGIAFAAEGAVIDWSGLFLSRVKAADPAAAATGLGLFMATMAAFRFLGDGVVARFGPRRTLVASGLGVTAGIAIALFVPGIVAGAAGFGLVGVAAANIVPILFSAAARVPGVPPAMGIAAVATLAYSGFLLGPPLLGFAADLLDLTAALSIVGLAGLVIAVGGRRLRT